MNKEARACDPSEEITPVTVRDTIIQCFVDAHKEVLEMMKEYHEFKSEEEFEEMKKFDVKFLVKSKFDEIGADFEDPTKENLTEVISKLAEFAASFRKPEIIKRHYAEMTELINKL